MKKNNKLRVMILIVSIMVLVGGVSLAYFAASGLLDGDGADTYGKVYSTGNSTVILKGDLDFNVTNVDEGIMPGHKTLSLFTVTASGSHELGAYYIQWIGTNEFSTPLNYSVYKTNTKIDGLEMICNKGSLVVDGKQQFKEECEINDNTELGDPIYEGTIESSFSEASVDIIGATNNLEYITTSPEGTIVYYYVVIEYPDTDEVQNDSENIENNDMLTNGFNGELSIIPGDADADILIGDIFVENADGDYEKKGKVPNSATGYYLADDSFCTNDSSPSWDYGNWALLVDGFSSKGTICDLYFKKGVNLSETIMALEGNGQVNHVIPQYKLWSNVDIVVKDAGYRYQGSNVDNYVWFNNEFWRIIGVEEYNGKYYTKLIRNESLHSDVYWDGLYAVPNWWGSDLYSYLNTNYLNSGSGYNGKSLSSSSKSLLYNFPIYNGTLHHSNGVLAEAGYIGNPQHQFTRERYNGNIESYSLISLMYPSDYALASPFETCKDVDLTKFQDCAKQNWIMNESRQWTLVKTGSGIMMWVVTSKGIIDDWHSSSGADVRPTVYLKSDVRAMGSGTLEDPYIVV